MPSASQALRSLRARMPVDGRGWAWPDDTRRLLFKKTAAAVKRRLPTPASAFLLAGARAGWLPFAFMEAWTYARRRGGRTPFQPLFLDCLMAGAWPPEAWLWRELFGERIEFGMRATSLLLSELGDAAGHRLLEDKAAAAAVLRDAGAPVPETLAIIRPGCVEQELQPLRDAGVGLAIKPQSGYGAHGLIMAEPLGDGRWRVNGADTGWEDFAGRLRRARTPLLAQARLRGARTLDGFLDAERPPILRIATARRPGAAPFVYGAILSTPVPGNAASTFVTKDIRAAVDLDTGRLDAALLFANPRRKLASVPWNGARIEGRILEGVSAAAQATLTAAAAVPALPVISWDVVLTDAGPVILEGNSMGNWLLVRFSGRGAGSLLPLLAEWALAAGAS